MKRTLIFAAMTLLFASSTYAQSPGSILPPGSLGHSTYAPPVAPIAAPGSGIVGPSNSSKYAMGTGATAQPVDTGPANPSCTTSCNSSDQTQGDTTSSADNSQSEASQSNPSSNSNSSQSGNNIDPSIQQSGNTVSQDGNKVDSNSNSSANGNQSSNANNSSASTGASTSSNGSNSNGSNTNGANTNGNNTMTGGANTANGGQGGQGGKGGSASQGQGQGQGQSLDNKNSVRGGDQSLRGGNQGQGQSSDNTLRGGNQHTRTSADNSGGNSATSVDTSDHSVHSSKSSLTVLPMQPSVPMSISPAASIALTADPQCGPYQRVIQTPVYGLFFGITHTSHKQIDHDDTLADPTPEALNSIWGARAIYTITVVNLAGARSISLGGGGSSGGWGQGNTGTTSSMTAMVTHITMRACRMQTEAPIVFVPAYQPPPIVRQDLVPHRRSARKFPVCLPAKK